MFKAILNTTLRVSDEDVEGGLYVIGSTFTAPSVDELPEYIRYELDNRPHNVTLSEFTAEEVAPEEDGAPPAMTSAQVKAAVKAAKVEAAKIAKAEAEAAKAASATEGTPQRRN